MFLILIFAVFFGKVVPVPIEENLTVEPKDFLPQILPQYFAEASMFEFDQYARKFAEDRAKSFNLTVEWFDLYGTHKYFEDNPVERGRQIVVTTKNFRYGKVQQTVDESIKLYSDWYCNNEAHDSTKTSISKEIPDKSSYTWKTLVGLKIAADLSVSASIPSIMDVHSKFSTELNLKSSETVAKENVSTFQVQYELNVRPQTAVRADYIIKQHQVIIPYEVDVHIDGWFTIVYSSGEHIYYPSAFLKGKELKQNKINKLGVIFTIKGEFTGVRGIEAVSRTAEYPIANAFNCAKAASYGPPTYIEEEKLPLVKINSSQFNK